METQCINHQQVSNQAALYPLPLTIFPQGRQRLRAVEPKLLAFITAACKLGAGFVIAFQPSTPESSTGARYDYGAYVTIVDFDYGDDGLLTIDVQAENLVAIGNVYQGIDGSWFGSTHFVAHWSMHRTVHWSRLSSDGGAQEVQYQRLSQVLQQLFLAHSTRQALYARCYFDCPEWVCGRLIELLPIPYKTKKNIIKSNDFQSVTSILSQLLAEI